MYNYQEYQSPLGVIYILTNDKEKLVGLWFENQQHFLGTYKDITRSKENNQTIQIIKNWLDAYFNGLNPNFDLNIIEFKGTPFQIRVWQELLKIPYGKTITYKELKEKVLSNKKGGFQAIGQAVGHNPISIIVPCHRVIGSNDKLTGYAGGVDKKKWLLNLENQLLKDCM